MIEAKNIRYSVPDREIIKGVDLHIKKGRFYGILGPNGSGKTTLMDIICGVIADYQGSIEVMGRDLKKYNKKDLAKLLALVPQNFNTSFSFSVEEILEMGRYPHKKKFSFLGNEDREIINGVVEELELENIIDKKITDLSGGERQRAIFGKALIQQTPILFLDESTSNLDPYYAHSLLKKVRDRVEEKQLTVISVFHDFTLASLYCDEIIFLKDGKVVKAGETEHTLTPENIKYVFNINSKMMESDNKKFVIPYM
ncbi:ABC transporter ATP-binding protein [Ilyobacter sp.]|uniref:ABC transporter ATP-binding protein n=1 Tax=Ilyobacter sp. TaxID=3100343 RepID=UPI0035617479